jgi:hypothetical protein
MSIRLSVLVLIVAVGVTLGCEGRSAQLLGPSTPGASALATAPGAAAAIVGGVERAVTMFDACDPETFDAQFGPGTCTRPGGVTFPKFIEELIRHGSAGAWHFAPGVLTMKVGQTLLVLNKGGEVHTFTEVDEFGGGIVPELNAILGLHEVAPECNLLAPADFLAPGDSSREVEDEEGVELYQCCIHPWMRAELRKSEK